MNVHEAKTHFSRLLDRVAAGEEITMVDRGRVLIAEDFDAPLPGDLLPDFES